MVDKHFDEMTQAIKERAKELYETYDYSERLIADAIKGAMVWVPLCMSRSAYPSKEQLMLLASQLIAVATATEISKDKRKAHNSGVALQKEESTTPA